jgi:[ribosomal protein S5]-alanine N-acetyltransferase
MLSPNFTPFPIITTKRLVLRKISMNDVNELFFMRTDERVMRYIDKPPAKSIDESIAFVKLIHDLETNNNAVTWAITFREDPKLIGTVCLWNLKKEHFRAELGYALHPDHHQKGIMHEVLESVINYGFNEMRLHSIEANVNPSNQASIKLLEKNKFTREAYFKENYFYDGKFLDTAIYSLLAP